MILKNEVMVSTFFTIKKEYEQKLLMRRDYLLDEVLPSLTGDGDYDDYMYFQNEVSLINRHLKKLY